MSHPTIGTGLSSSSSSSSPPASAPSSSLSPSTVAAAAVSHYPSPAIVGPMISGPSPLHHQLPGGMHPAAAAIYPQMPDILWKQPSHFTLNAAGAHLHSLPPPLDELLDRDRAAAVTAAALYAQERERYDRLCREKQEREAEKKKEKEREKQERLEKERLEKQMVEQAVHEHFKKTQTLGYKKRSCWNFLGSSSSSPANATSARVANEDDGRHRVGGGEHNRHLGQHHHQEQQARDCRIERDKGLPSSFTAFSPYGQMPKSTSSAANSGGDTSNTSPTAVIHGRGSTAAKQQQPQMLPKGGELFGGIYGGGYPTNASSYPHPHLLAPPPPSSSIGAHPSSQDKYKIEQLKNMVVANALASPSKGGDHRDKEMASSSPTLDMKNSVIVKNDASYASKTVSPFDGRNLSPGVHSPGAKKQNYLPAPLPLSMKLFEYRGPSLSPQQQPPPQQQQQQPSSSQNYRAGGAQQRRSPVPIPQHHRQSPQTSPHRGGGQHSPHPIGVRVGSPPEQPQRYGALPSGVVASLYQKGTSVTSGGVAGGSYAYPPPPSPSAAAPHTLSKQKVSSPAPTQIYGKPSSGASGGGQPPPPIVCISPEISLSSTARPPPPPPLAAKMLVTPSPYQQLAHHQMPPNSVPKLSANVTPPPAHSARPTSVLDDVRLYAKQSPSVPVPVALSLTTGGPMSTGAAAVAAATTTTTATTTAPTTTSANQTADGFAVKIETEVERNEPCGWSSLQPLNLGVREARAAVADAINCEPPEVKSECTMVESAEEAASNDDAIVDGKCGSPAAAVERQQPPLEAVEQQRDTSTPQDDENGKNGNAGAAQPQPPVCSSPGTTTPAKVGGSSSSAASWDGEKSNSPKPPTYGGHKLKKAWLQRHSGEDVVDEKFKTTTQPPNASATVGESHKNENNGNSVTDADKSTDCNSPSTSGGSAPSPCSSSSLDNTNAALTSLSNSLNSIGSMAVNSINKKRLPKSNSTSSNKKSKENRASPPQCPTAAVLNGRTGSAGESGAAAAAAKAAARSSENNYSGGDDNDMSSCPPSADEADAAADADAVVVAKPSSSSAASSPKRHPPKLKRKKDASCARKSPCGRGDATSSADAESTKRKKLHSTSGTESDKESASEKDSDTNSATTKKAPSGAGGTAGGVGNGGGGGGAKKRGRKRKEATGGGGESPPSSQGGRNDSNSSSSDDPKEKKFRDDSNGEDNNKSNDDPFSKPSISRLKKTGESFLQDGACFEVAPKLAKCRECRWTQNQRSKSNANIFCRFYAFRRLRYTKNGQLAIAGFSDPYKDASGADLNLWLPDTKNPPVDLDLELARFTLVKVGDQFCDLLKQEAEAIDVHMSDDKKVAWKRVVQGVREMCDVCETTLFNFHWACSKCGFVVCIDCYKSRKNGTVKIWRECGKDRDDLSWLLCTNRQPHEQEKLMLTQIIAGDSLSTLAKLSHEACAMWNINMYCGCALAQNAKPGSELCKKILLDLKQEKQKKTTTEHAGGVGRDENAAAAAAAGAQGRVKSENGTAASKEEKASADGGDAQPRNDSPLNWLADVALSDQSKTAGDEDGDTSDDSSDGNFSTLRELLVRPSNKAAASPGATANSPNAAATADGTTSVTSTTSATTTNAAGGEQQPNSPSSSSNACPAAAVGNKTKQKKSNVRDFFFDMVFANETEGNDDNDFMDDRLTNSGGVELKYFIRSHVKEYRGRGYTPIRIMTLSESKLLYPDVPHSWLCEGKLLRLLDSVHPGNYTIFQEQWKRGQPVIVSDVTKHLTADLWHPDSFIKDFGDVKNDLINCMTGNIVPNQQMRKFWEGFEYQSRRLKDDKGIDMLLKLKDWPPGEDFAEMLPSRYNDLMNVLPLGEYTQRNGRLNLASRLPDCFVRPDLGPKMYNAYGSAMHPSKGTTNLHLDISDAVNVMVYVGIPKDGDNEEHIKEAYRAIDEAGCDILTRRRVREKGELPGALWHIYSARDADKIRDFLNKVAIERGDRLEPNHDPIHDQSCYLDGSLRDRLSREYQVEGYAIVQCMGDALFVPAGAPHQVRNLHNCIKVAEDFVSPENVSHCFHLTQEFRALSDTHSNHEDKLQIKNIMYHAVKDSLSVLGAAFGATTNREATTTNSNATAAVATTTTAAAASGDDENTTSNVKRESAKSESNED